MKHFNVIKNLKDQMIKFRLVIMLKTQDFKN